MAVSQHYETLTVIVSNVY